MTHEKLVNRLQQLKLRSLAPKLSPSRPIDFYATKPVTRTSLQSRKHLKQEMQTSNRDSFPTSSKDTHQKRKTKSKSTAKQMQEL